MKLKAQHLFYTFIVSSLLTMLFEYLNMFELQLVFKPLIILSLYFYYKRLANKKIILYELALLLAFLSNLLFLDRSIPSFLFFGVFFTVAYLAIFIYFILKLSHKQNFLAVLATSTPLLCIAAYQIYLFRDNLESNFWLIILGGFIICMYSGLSFYTYFLMRSRKTRYLLISGICMFSTAIFFSIEVFFLNSDILRVPVIGSYALLQFSFMKFILEEESEEDALYLEENLQ